MGCISQMYFHQPNPLLFSSFIVWLVVVNLAKPENKPALIRFYADVQTALLIIFCIAMMGIVCPTACDYPCSIYSNLQGKEELYWLIAIQAVLKALFLLVAILFCKLIFITDVEQDKIFLAFSKLVKITSLVIFLELAASADSFIVTRF